jgi:hypothetical protein
MPAPISCPFRVVGRGTATKRIFHAAHGGDANGRGASSVRPISTTPTAKRRAERQTCATYVTFLPNVRWRGHDKSLRKLARRRGFEPLTPRFVVWCSIQLSYRRKGPRGRGAREPRHT